MGLGFRGLGFYGLGFRVLGFRVLGFASGSGLNSVNNPTHPTPDINPNPKSKTATSVTLFRANIGT